MAKYTPSKDVLIVKQPVLYYTLDFLTVGKKYKIIGHRKIESYEEYQIIGDDGFAYWFSESALEEHFDVSNTDSNFDYAMGVI